MVALRADMDALPVAEDVDVPFKSTVRSSFNGQDVGVMHACGHDAHTAILMATAELLAGMREDGLLPRYNAEGNGPARAAPNHSPRFFVDEAALVPGIKAMASLTLDYLQGAKAAAQ